MVDIEKFICSLIHKSSGYCVINVIDIINALHNQGLDYKDGNIVKITPESQEFDYEDVNISQKDFAPQNPIWNEEDRTMLDEMYKFFDKHKVPYLKHNMDDYAKFIKYLKDRYTWKPSEMQMKALDIAIRCGIKLGTWEEAALKELMEQLKIFK